MTVSSQHVSGPSREAKRSSTTTVLASSLLRNAGAEGSPRDKLLTFTDNRQDASLQAGHFNDFVHVSLLRSALHAALTQHRELTFDRVSTEVVDHCGLLLRDVARNIDIDAASSAAQDVWRVFTDLTEYRLYEDLRRGWRVVQPNLENVGLLRIGYRGLESLCKDDRAWQSMPQLGAMASADRERIVRPFLDQFRRKLAISCRCLQEQFQPQLRRRAEQMLNEFWGLDPEVFELRSAEKFAVPGQSTRPVEGYSLGERSTLGRFLIGEVGLTSGEYPQFLSDFLSLLGGQGLLDRKTVDDHQVTSRSSCGTSSPANCSTRAPWAAPVTSLPPLPQTAGCS